MKIYNFKNPGITTKNFDYTLFPILCLLILAEKMPIIYKYTKHNFDKLQKV